MWYFSVYGTAETVYVDTNKKRQGIAAILLEKGAGIMDVLYRDASDGNLHVSTVKDIYVDSREGFDVWLDDDAYCKTMSKADYEESLTEGFRNERVDFSNFYFEENVGDDADEQDGTHGLFGFLFRGDCRR